MPGKNSQLRNKYRRRKLAESFKATCCARRLPCHLCGEDIDYAAPKGSPTSFEADHYYPLATHPHLAFIPANLRPSHSKCNRSRGADVMPTSQWVKPAW